MTQLYDILKPESKYYDRKNYTSQQQYNQALRVSSTVYVGNLSFYTSQQSVKELFGRAGNVRQIIMGINDEGNPCGFCFVIFQSHQDALYAVEYISKTKLCDRIIRVDWDAGFIKGRQKGRGRDGQQRRDDFRRADDVQRPKKRVHTNYGDRGERADRGQRRYDNNNRYDRGERGDKGDRYERGNRQDSFGNQKRQRSDRRDRAERNDRTERNQDGKRERPSNQDQPEDY